ncbi:hypothetical protein M2146_001078 [Lachnospiraceae bacterium PF1-22]
MQKSKTEEIIERIRAYRNEYIKISASSDDYDGGKADYYDGKAEAMNTAIIIIESINADPAYKDNSDAEKYRKAISLTINDLHNIAYGNEKILNSATFNDLVHVINHLRKIIESTK